MLGQLGALAENYHPSDDVTAGDVHDDVGAEVGPLGWSARLDDIPTRRCSNGGDTNGRRFNSRLGMLNPSNAEELSAEHRGAVRISSRSTARPRLLRQHELCRSAAGKSPLELRICARAGESYAAQGSTGRHSGG